MKKVPTLTLMTAAHSVLVMEIGERIREIRTRREMSLGDLGEETGIDRGYLGKIENARIKAPRPDTLRKIAEGLGTTVGDLFGEPAGGEVIMLQRSECATDALKQFLLDKKKTLALDERFFLEHVLETNNTSAVDDYGFWADELSGYRGSPQQKLLRFTIGEDPTFGADSLQFMGTIWSAVYMLTVMADAHLGSLRQEVLAAKTKRREKSTKKEL